MRLADIQSPNDIKKLSYEEMYTLCGEIRGVILDTVIKNGGHLASNLGVVELTVALNKVFNFDRDKIIFDVGHQCYAHKLLTGRLGQFDTLRRYGGISGFPKRSESVYDFFDTGHSGTSISVGLGMARARDYLGLDYDVISLVGDASLTNGMSFEALNDSGNNPSKQIIILNDNNMSISKNVGAVSHALQKLRENSSYKEFKKSVVNSLKTSSPDDNTSYNRLKRFKDSIKYAIMDGVLFEEFGFKYLGPIDGHNLEELVEYLTIAKNEDSSILVHVITKKGKGCIEAEECPEKFHGVKPLCAENTGITFSNTLGDTLYDMMRNNESIAVVSAAMTDSTGLNKVCKEKLFFDVGIAEEHAVTMCAGLAASGLKPYFAVYSSFLQRSFDQIVHDVALPELPVTLCVDRAGVVGDDGETHQGIFDISYLSIIPNMTLLSPMNRDELRLMLTWSQTFGKPLAIRYPKAECEADVSSTFEPFKWQRIHVGDSNIVILATGAAVVSNALSAVRKLYSSGVGVDLYNASSIKPMDLELLNAIKDKRIVVLEDNVSRGGLGEAVRCYYSTRRYFTEIYTVNMGDGFVAQGSVDQIYDDFGLSSPKIYDFINNLLKID